MSQVLILNHCLLCIYVVETPASPPQFTSSA